jgi:hypothetical protein
MFEAERKGVLATRGVPWTDEEIALAVGGRFDETMKCITELVTKGVASRNERGALMNRRMYRDEKVRDDTRERVRKHRSKAPVDAHCNGNGNGNVRQCTETEYETGVVEAEVLPEKPVDPSMFASAVLLECRLAGRNLRLVLEEVARAEQSHGEDLEVMAEQAIKAWADYGAVKSQLDYQWGAEKFYGDGHWKTPDTWPYSQKKSSKRAELEQERAEMARRVEESLNAE